MKQVESRFAFLREFGRDLERHKGVLVEVDRTENLVELGHCPLLTSARSDF